MTAPLWRNAVASSAAMALAATLTGTVTVTTAQTADAATCRATPTLLSRTPTVTHLAGGATARIWDTGPTPSNPQASTRIVAVTVPAASAANPRVRAASNLNSARIPSAYFLDAPSAVVMVNGGVFNPTVGAMPDLPQMTYGWLRKARSTHDPAIVTARDGRSLPSRLWITGTVTASGHGYKAVTGLNWQSLAGSGINAYTPSWGKARRPYGTADVVVAGGKVVAVRTGTTRGQPAASGQTILTATGTAGSWLASFRIGTSVSISYRAATDAPFPVYEAVGRGARFLNQGVKNGGTCTSRDEQLRPRTAIGWTRSGTCSSSPLRVGPRSTASATAAPPSTRWPTTWPSSGRGTRPTSTAVARRPWWRAPPVARSSAWTGPAPSGNGPSPTSSRPADRLSLVRRTKDPPRCVEGPSSLVSGGGLEPPRPIKGTSTSS